MRVLFISPSLRSGGAERQLFELVSALARAGTDIEPRAITLGDANDVYSPRLRELGVDCRCLPAGSHIARLRTLLRWVGEARPDVLHGFLNIGCLYAQLAAWRHRLPLVASAIRDAQNQSWKYELGYALLARSARFFVSNSRAGFDCRYRRWRRNFEVVYNGMHLERFQHIQPLPPLQGAGVGLVMVASLSHHKDHATLFRALDHPLLKEHDRCRGLRLQLVGDEPPNERGNRERLQALARELAVDDRVEFLGYRGDVEAILATADISVLLSNSRVHQEGLSNAIAESMALGRPVIATRAGGTPELIEDGVSGLLVADGDADAVARAIRRLLDEPALAARLGTRARERILADFSVERMMTNYIALYRRAINKEGVS